MKVGIAVFLATGLLMFAVYKRSQVATIKSHAAHVSPAGEMAKPATAIPAGGAETASTETTQASADNSPSSTDSSYSHSDISSAPEVNGSLSSTNSSYWYSEPPHVDAAMSVEEAYAAIPHRRTVWTKDDTTVPTGEREYLAAIFQALDQAVVVQVVGVRSYSRKDFEGFDAEANLDRLIEYVQDAHVPPGLSDYNSQIVAALSGERQFFRDWKDDPDRFDYAQQLQSHQALTRSDAALHVAYQDLLSRYPRESQSNRDAFYDYLCAADFR